MRMRWATALAAAAAIVLAGLPVAASATEPLPLDRGYVTDEAGALSGSERQAAETRLGDLASSTDAALFVVFVPTFTEPAAPEGWANDVAELNGLGPHQYLLAVAVDSRQYYLSADSAGPLNEDQVIALERAAEDRLAVDDWSGAIAVVADGIDDVVGSDAGSVGVSVGGGGALAIGAVVVIGGIALVVWLLVRRRRGSAKGATTPPPPVSLEDLERQASSLLVQTDDAVRTSEEELGFARAQFGEAATAEFAATLEAARGKLAEAFSIKQRLDDTDPETPDDKRALTTQIIDLCRSANESLDEKAADFDELRQLEQNAPEALNRVQDEHATVAAGIAAAQQSLETLRERYSTEALATVADNVDQATSRLAFARDQLTEAQHDIGAGRGGEAAVGIRAAEEAVDQARLLEQAIDTLSAELARSDESAAALVREIEQDLATAASLPDPDGRIAAVTDTVRRDLDAARADLAQTTRDPLATLARLQSANEQIDALITGVRDEQQRQQRARQQLDQTIMQAQGQVSAAQDFITARRGAVGAEARTRLAEAGASLSRAQQLQPTDPSAALQQAQRANQLAAQATQVAQRDVGAFPGSGGGGGSGGDLMGAVLGGIVINSLMGGGRSRGGGFGGLGGGGGVFGGGGGGRSSGRGGSRPIRPGSFGGGGTRARRGGGRF